jgi:SAM-dependent methyltransferase/TusA-related sulfurtransferase
MVYINGAKRDLIFDAIRVMYTDVAQHPERGYHVPIGHAACTLAGYPAGQLARLPASAVESFAGVGYPFAANVIRAGDTVLDIGSGSGTDVLLAAQAVGPAGQVIGLDLTAAMLAKLEANVVAAGVRNVRVLEGNAERIPLPDASVDVVTSNGVLNLVPDKGAAFAEIHRVLKPGGRLQIADVALRRPLTGDCLSNPSLWAECILGATLEDEYMAMLDAAGLACVAILGRLDYFAASSSAETRSIARSFNAGSIVVRASKPPVSPLPAPSLWPPAAMPMVSAGGSHMATARVPDADATLNGDGLVCGSLEPAMRDALRALASGQVLEVRSDDPAARLGVPAWCRLASHTFLTAIEEDNCRTRFFLRKR